MNKYRLYLWYKDVFRDYSSGMAMAIAESEEQARDMIMTNGDYAADPRDCGMDAPPDEVREIDKPSFFVQFGGG